MVAALKIAVKVILKGSFAALSRQFSLGQGQCRVPTATFK
jgi:hypothetical protein